MKRWIKYLAFFAMLVPFFFNGTEAKAAEATPDVNIILHKIVFPNGEMPEDMLNTGDTNGEHASMLQDYRGLNDVTFEAYDVSAKFYEARAEGKSVEEAQAAMTGLNAADLGTPVNTQTTSDIDGEDGTASFSLPSKSGEKDAVYLFRETDAPDVVEEKSHDLVVVLPVENTAGETMSTIHLYPKNEEVVHQEPGFEKTVAGKEDSYTFGDIIPFEISVEIPQDILDYKKFVIHDTADPSLVFQADSLQVTESEQALNATYEVTPSDHGFSINFTDIKALGKFAGKELMLHYDMMLVTANAEGSSFANEAVLDTDHETITKEVTVDTGGHHFVKVDLENTKTTLAGAQFRVLNQKGQFLVKTTDGFAWTDDEKNSALVILESAKDGSFAINGLAYGKYALKEIKAPQGYELSTTPVDFTITRDSYTAGATGVLQVVNLKTPEPVKPAEPTVPTVPATPEKPKADPEKPIKVFPKTGETTNHMIIVFGAVLIAVVAVMWWQKNKKGKEE